MGVRDPMECHFVTFGHFVVQKMIHGQRSMLHVSSSVFDVQLDLDLNLLLGDDPARYGPLIAIPCAG